VVVEFVMVSVKVTLAAAELLLEVASAAAKIVAVALAGPIAGPVDAGLAPEARAQTASMPAPRK
jgi:hypothetical protein